VKGKDKKVRTGERQRES